MKKLKDYLLENYVKENGDLDIRGLDLSDFDGDVYIGEMKVKGNLYQSSQKVEGYLYQDNQQVKGYLYQESQKVEGDLHQSYQEVEGNLRQNFQKVEGNLHQYAQKVKGILWDDKPKIELSTDEIIILRSVDEKYKYIARDDNSYGSLKVYEKEPIKRDTHYLTSDLRSDFDYLHGFYHLFKDITFESGVHLIADLIKENEKWN